MWVFISFFLLRYFVYVFDLVIFANAIFIALERNDAEVLFLVLFNIEILLKLYTYGFKEFFSRYWNKLVFTFNLLFQLCLSVLCFVRLLLVSGPAKYILSFPVQSH